MPQVDWTSFIKVKAIFIFITLSLFNNSHADAGIKNCTSRTFNISKDNEPREVYYSDTTMTIKNNIVVLKYSLRSLNIETELNIVKQDKEYLIAIRKNQDLSFFQILYLNKENGDFTFNNTFQHNVESSSGRCRGS